MAKSLLFFLGGLFLLPIMPLAAQNPAFDQLVRSKRYTELARRLAAEDVSAADRMIYQAFLDNVFGHPMASNRLIAKAMEENTGRNDSLHYLLLEAQHDNYVKLFDYAQASRTKNLLLKNYRSFYTPEDLEDEQQVALIWEALRREPPQRVIHASPQATLAFTADRIGLHRLPIQRGDQTFSFIFDTGAGISTVTESFAKAFGLRLLPDVRVIIKGGITGLGTAVQLAISESFFIGTAEVKNAVFLVFPDSALTFQLPDGPMTLDAILGFPVIKELGTLTLYPDKIEISQLDTESQVPPNLAVDLLKPVVFMRFQGEELPFTFDSGAGTSILTEVFYEKYRDWVDRTGHAKEERTGGAGGIKTMQVIVLPSISFQSNGQTLTIPNISVSKEAVSTGDGVYFGNIGQDLIQQYASWTINFKDSWIRFNP